MKTVTTKDGRIAVAESEEEAWLEARKSALQFGYDFDVFDDNAQEHIIRVAQDAKEGGWPQAEKMIIQPKLDKTHSTMQENREQHSAADFDEIGDQLNNRLADDIFNLARKVYVGGENRNPTYHRSCTQVEVDDALEIWKDIDEVWEPKFAKNFHGFRRQDKAAVGKGNVGDTLARRGVQANFISTWGAHKINVHVDIEG